MKVLILNGSPNVSGCTARALREVEVTLNSEGIVTETVVVGNKAIRGCIDCRACKSAQVCVIDDILAEIAKKFEEADGIVIGTPVYYAGANATLLALLDRLFRSTKFSKLMKVGAVVLSSRRAGSTSAYDEINKYFTIAGMPIVSSTYWNEVHGSCADDVEKDLEGLQTMRNLGLNMAFMIKAVSLAKEKYGLPKNERTHYTCFHDGK